MHKLYGREREFDALKKYAELHKNVLIKGRRGIGKTHIVRALIEDLKSNRNIKAIYINCEKITTPSTLLSEAGFRTEPSLSPDDVLNELFRNARESGVEIIALDEFVFLVRDFAKRKPYRNAERVIAHLRGLISEFPGATIFTASSLWKLYKLIRGYERRLARMFDVVIKLDALTLEDSAKIAYDITGDLESSSIIAELGDGVPFYVESIALTSLRCADPYEAFVEELTRGALNELFRALFSDMPPSAREIVYLLSQSPRTFESLKHSILDNAMPYSLEYLVEMDIVGRIEKGRRVTYFIKDKTFRAWVTINRKPHVAREMHKITRVLSLGFEALVRELFLAITSETEIDTVQGKITFGPTDIVKRLDIDGEVNLMAIDAKGRTIISEITIRENPKRKIRQLLETEKKLRKKMGIREPMKLLITYKPPSETVIKLAKRNNVHIITQKHLNKLARIVRYRPI